MDQPILNNIEYQLVGRASLARQVAAMSLAKFGAKKIENRHRWLGINQHADVSGIVIRNNARTSDAVIIHFVSQPLTAQSGVQAVLSSALSLWNPGHWIPYGDVIAGLIGTTRGLAALAANSQGKVEVNIHQARAMGQLVPKAFLPHLSSRMLGTLNSPWLGIMNTKDSSVYCHLMIAKHARTFLSAFSHLLPDNRKSSLMLESARDPSQSLGLKESREIRSTLQHLLQSRSSQWWHAGAVELGIILEPIVSGKHWQRRIKNDFAAYPLAHDWQPQMSLHPASWTWQSTNQRLRPLDGLRVLDISQIVAGPFCGMLLSDLGANVTHVQLPKRLFQQFHSLLAPIFQKSKRQVTLDLTDEGQKRAIEEFLFTFDPHMVVHNLRPEALTHLLTSSPLGILWSKAHFVGIQAFPKGQLAGFEQSIQAATGLMIERSHRPRLLPLAIHDIICGSQAALAAVVSLWSNLTVEVATSLSQAHLLLNWASQQKNPPCPVGKAIWQIRKDSFFPADNADCP